MVAAISSVLTLPPAAGSAWSKDCYFKIPNLRAEVKRQIGKANAYAAWHGIFDAMNDQLIRGRTDQAKIDAATGKVGVGIHAIARETGVDPSTIRRQLRRLEKIGLIVMVQTGRLHIHDPATGKITTKSKGRTPPVMVYVTVLDEHLRPFKRKGALCNPSGGGLKVHNANPSKDTKNYQRPPSGRTFGTGRRTAGKAGGHSAAKAGQERGTNFEVTANRPGLTFTDGPRPPKEFEGEDAERLRLTRERLAAEQAKRDREDAEAAIGRQEAPQAPTTLAQAEADLRQAVEILPPAKRQRCHQLGRDAKAEADRIAADEKLLADAIAKYQADQAAAADAEATGKRAVIAGKAETYRQAYRQERAKAATQEAAV
jgi:predicted transcriptional regulator